MPLQAAPGDVAAQPAGALESPRERALRSGPRRERGILALTLILAATLPAAAHWHVQRRVTADLAPALSRALGDQVQVGGVDAGLLGTVRLLDVRLGLTVRADAMEAAVALSRDGLARGALGAELRIERPRVRVAIDRGGRVSMHGLLERLRGRLGAGPGHDGDGAAAAPQPALDALAARAAAHGLHRIVVADGVLAIDVAGCGRIDVRGFAIHPHRRGVRAVLAESAVDLRCGAWRLHGHLGRAAADIALPALALERFLTVGGRLAVVPTLRGGPAAEVSTALAPTVLADVSVSHGVSGAPGIDVRGRLERPGEDARWRAWLQRTDERVRLRLEGRDLSLLPLAPLVPRGIELGAARGSGHFDFVLGERFGVALDASVTGVVVNDRRVARRPFELAGAIAADVTGTREQIAVERLDFSTGALRVEAHGRMHYDGPGYWLPDRGELTVTVPRVGCAQALTSLPAGLREDLDGMVLTGELEAALALRFDRGAVAHTDLDMDLDVNGCRVLHEATEADPRRLRAPFEYERADGTRARIGAGAPGHVALDELPVFLPRAFVSAEDGRFFDHPGFDLYQIERSLAVDLRDAAFVRGGSTISQQLIKNVFLTRHRTLARKLQEAVLTWRLEAHLGKHEILEYYLNIIELGPGIFGVDAAARYWFGKPATELELREAAFLAALTPAPRTLSRRILATGSVDRGIEDRVDAILQGMRRDRVVPASAYRRAQGDLKLRADLAASGD